VIIALEGLPGAGKTTTAKLLAEQRGDVSYLHERSAEHPFLNAFYSTVERYKFETELCFVLLHYHQYRDIEPEHTVVLDYSPVKDIVFADLNLGDEDHRLFTAIYRRTSGSLPTPDVAIFLDLELGHVLDRIAQRGREYEAGMDPEYLRALGAAYEHRFLELGQRVERIPVAASDRPQEVAAAVAAAIWRP
jgi:deoxyguanosine kinase